MTRRTSKFHRRSRKGTTLVELIVALTLTMLFAVVCIALINPIERMYQSTVKISRAQLLADTVIDSIRKECDDVKCDEHNAVWIARGTDDADDASLFNGPTDSVKRDKGPVLVVKRNNNYCEAIYSCFKISDANVQAVMNNRDKEESSGLALFDLGNVSDTGVIKNDSNLERGYVHFAYYQAIDDENGIRPFRAYDYTNPIAASSYGKYSARLDRSEFSVKLEFSNLVYKNSEHPAFVICKVSVYDGLYDPDNSSKNLIYTRESAVSFSANGSSKGTGSNSGGGHNVTPVTKNVDVRVRWVDENGQVLSAWPSEVTSLTFKLNGSSPARTGTLASGYFRFQFANVTLTGTPSLEWPSVKNYTGTCKGNADQGYVVTYKYNKQKTVKLITGTEFIKKIDQNNVVHVIFGKKSDYPEFNPKDGTRVAIPYTAAYNSSNTKDDYLLYKKKNAAGEQTAYVLSDDGEFVFNDDCTKMFINCPKLKTITGITYPDDNIVFDTSLTYTMKSMLEGCELITTFVMPGFVTSTCKSTEAMFKGCVSVTSYDFSGWDTSNVTNMNYMFAYFHGIKPNGNGNSDPFTIDVSDLSFDSCTTMKYMFACDADQYQISLSSRNLTKIILPGDINTSNVTNMQGAFSKNVNLEEIVNLDQLDGDKITTCKEMFFDCQKLYSVSMPNFVHKDCTTLESMFKNCYALTEAELTGWNTANVTTCKTMFVNCHELKTISLPGVVQKNCTNLESMFENCYALTKAELASWDTRGVTTIKNMFKGDKELTSVVGLSGRDFAALTICESPFSGCVKLLDLDISGIKLPKITNADTFKKLFTGSSIKNLNMSDATLALTSFDNLFKSYKQFETIDFSNVVVGNTATNVSAKCMFMDCTNLRSVNIQYNKDNAFKLTNGYQMFKGCTNLTDINLTGLISKNCESMEEMFFNCSSIKGIDFAGSDYSGMKTMKDLCRGCSELKSLDLTTNCNVSSTNAINCQSIVRLCKKIEYFKAEGLKVSSLQQAFDECNVLSTIEISNIDVSECKYLNSMFKDCYKLEEFDFNCFVRDSSSGILRFDKVVSMEKMFYNCSSLSSIKNMTNISFAVLTDSYISDTGVTYTTSMKHAFFHCTQLSELDISGISIPSVTGHGTFLDMFLESSIKKINMSGATLTGFKTLNLMFKNRNYFNSIDLSNATFGPVGSAAEMFNGCSYLTKIDLSGVKLNSCTTCMSMFTGCTALKEANLSNIELNSCTTCESMFNGCTKLETIVMRNFKTPLCINMSYMFKNCYSVRGEVILTGWDTRSVTTMASMFENFATNNGSSRTIYSNDPGYVYLDISSFNFSTVEQCNQMFNVEKNTYTDLLKKVILPVNADATSVITTKQMFRNRTGIEEITNLGTFKTSGSLSDATSTFADCQSLVTIDVSSMNFSGVRYSNFMFNAANGKGGKLTTIYVSANSEDAFNPSILTSGNSSRMFENRVNLVGGKGTHYNSGKLDLTYARIDEGPSSARPGYFSVK